VSLAAGRLTKNAAPGPDIIKSLIARHSKQVCAGWPTISIAMNSRLPAIGAAREFADAGGLMSYGVNLPDLARQTATYVEKILKGAKPAELPVEQPTTFEIVLNLKTAKELGLTVSREFQLITDDVIE
jgi:putative tryptophan/tyrosine transport system substrate-binding protein